MKYRRLAIAAAALLFPAAVYAQTEVTLVQFTGSGGTASGGGPNGSLIVSGGSLFGMTGSGGANGDGNIFSVGSNGTNFQNLVFFTGSGGTADGSAPFGNLTLVDSELYGMTLGSANQ